MGALDYLSNVCSVTETKRTLRRKKRRKPLQTVEIKVEMDCDGCERRVKHAVNSLEGVTSVEVSRNQNRVRVMGHVEASKVLRKVSRSTGKRAELWPYVAYNLTTYPYAPQVYDDDAPSGFVRNVAQAFPVQRALLVDDDDEEEEDEGDDGGGVKQQLYNSLFSDDNPNACSIM